MTRQNLDGQNPDSRNADRVMVRGLGLWGLELELGVRILTVRILSDL